MDRIDVAHGTLRELGADSLAALTLEQCYQRSSKCAYIARSVCLCIGRGNILTSGWKIVTNTYAITHLTTDVSVPMDLLIGVNATLSALVAFVTDRVHHPSPSVSRDQPLKDCILPDDYKWIAGSAPNGPHSHVLVTGATSRSLFYTIYAENFSRRCHRIHWSATCCITCYR